MRPLGRTLLLCVCLCVVSANSSFAQEPGLSQAVNRLRSAYQKSFNEGNLDQLMTLYTPTADVLSPDGTVYVGHTEIRSFLDAVLKAKPKLKLKDDTTRYLSSTIVVEDGFWKLEHQQTVEGRYLAVVMKTNGKWQLVCLRWNPHNDASLKLTP